MLDFDGVFSIIKVSNWGIYCSSDSFGMIASHLLSHLLSNDQLVTYKYPGWDDQSPLQYPASRVDRFNTVYFYGFVILLI